MILGHLTYDFCVLGSGNTAVDMLTETHFGFHFHMLLHPQSVTKGGFLNTTYALFYQ